jgi:hypothetical protein
MPDDGFMKKLEHNSTFWTVKDIAHVLVVTDAVSVYLGIQSSQWDVLL